MKYELLNKDMKKIKKKNYKMVDFTGYSLLSKRERDDEVMKFKAEKLKSPLQAIQKQYVRVFLLVLAALFFVVNNVHASVRIKEIAYFQGVHENQLLGYGLVVGLNGTGDKSQSVFTVKSIASLLERLGVKVDAGKISPKNVAAVMITADLPPFIKSGAKIDITLSSLGDASSLQGGTLLLTPLQGADGKVYAVAQGQVSVGGFEAGSRGGSFGTVARIPQGAVIENEVPVTLVKDDAVNLSLNKTDFTTCMRVAEAINVEFQEKIAEALDGATVNVKVPEAFKNNIVRFISKIERVEVEPDKRAKIVINERTGTIVGGHNVKIDRVSLAHKDINIEIKPKQENLSKEGAAKSAEDKSFVPSASGLFSEGEVSHILAEPEQVTVGEVAKTLNSLGVKPADMISIFQAIKTAGAIQGDLIII